MLRLRNVSALSRGLKTLPQIQPQNPTTTQPKNTPKSQRPQKDAAPHPKLTPFQHIPEQHSVAGCRELKDVERLFSEYLEQVQGGEPVNASSLVLAVLETCRTRGSVFRQQFENQKRKFILKQDTRLYEILDKILNDIKSEKTFLGSYGMVFLFTALSSIKRADAVETAWIMLCERAKTCEKTAHATRTPHVVAAALNHAPSGATSLEFIEETYAAAVAETGPSIHLDEALVNGLIKSSTPEAVAEKYAQIIEAWAAPDTMRTVDRIFNRILTDLDSLEVSEAFFEMGMAGECPSYVHPGAVAAYLQRLARRTLDTEKIQTTTKRAISYYAEHHPAKPFDDFSVLLNAWKQGLMAAFPEDSQAARALVVDALDHVEAIYPQQRFLSSCISFATTQWPDSPFKLELAERLLKHTQLAPSSCRVILNTQPSLEVVERAWMSRTQSPQRLNQYDVYALIKAAATPEVAKHVAPIVGTIYSALERQEKLEVRDYVIKSPLLLLEVQEVAPHVLE